MFADEGIGGWADDNSGGGGVVDDVLVEVETGRVVEDADTACEVGIGESSVLDVGTGFGFTGVEEVDVAGSGVFDICVFDGRGVVVKSGEEVGPGLVKDD